MTWIIFNIYAGTQIAIRQHGKLVSCGVDQTNSQKTGTVVLLRSCAVLDLSWMRMVRRVQDGGEQTGSLLAETRLVPNPRPRRNRDRDPSLSRRFNGRKMVVKKPQASRRSIHQAVAPKLEGLDPPPPRQNPAQVRLRPNGCECSCKL